MAFIEVNILIVEDDELNRELLKRRLEVDGYNITTVSAAKDALELLKSTKFDLVLLDINLPDVNGDILLEQIHSNPQLNETQVMMVTADGEREMVLKCIEAGAVDFVVKPCAMSIVKSRVWRCLKNAEMQSGLQDIEKSKLLLVDDQELNRDVLAHRLKKSGYVISSCTNGKEAIEILKKESFDLILLDIMLPEISGIEVLKEIRKLKRHDNTPVIMITAVDEEEAINECMSAGADDYILKPFNTVLLKLRITSCLQSRRPTK